VGKVSVERGKAAARKRAAAETYAQNETALQRTALRHSLCADDADDALQRALEIVLRKAPTNDPRELVKWMQTVVKHEAMAIRSERERILPNPAAVTPPPGGEDWTSFLPTPADGPFEQAERREAIARSREALQALKPQELRALTLLAAGYSYVEIGAITGYSQTKINRCLAEGRERYRKLVSRSEAGERCTELQPLLSAFCDGEAKADEVATLREHLRACAHCRATLRAYRAAPAAAAALTPALPLHRSLWERAHDALSGIAQRLRGGDSTVQVAGSGAGGMGAAAVAKVAAICIGTAGGAAACVAAGLVPSPLDLLPTQDSQVRVERRLTDMPIPESPAPKVDDGAAPKPESKPKRERDPQPTPAAQPVAQQPPEESEPVAAEPAPTSTEYVPPPEPVVEPAPVASSGGGSPAGEFGP
jgi:RNA polymerase sigma factor (sigma-70 family)